MTNKQQSNYDKQVNRQTDNLTHNRHPQTSQRTNKPWRM